MSAYNGDGFVVRVFLLILLPKLFPSFVKGVNRRKIKSESEKR